jgi:hypothetical protein
MKESLHFAGLRQHISASIATVPLGMPGIEAVGIGWSRVWPPLVCNARAIDQERDASWPLPCLWPTMTPTSFA